MKKSHSSKQWLRRHVNDPYVQRSKKEGYRSRSAYKLTEIDERDKVLRPGMVVVDLGAAPGGWSQLVRKLLQDRNGLDAGRVVALDILDMPPLAGVDFIHGDFREDEALSRLEAVLGGAEVDLVLSDMAPNMSGVDAVDQPRGMYLAELARDFADTHLRVGGTFLTKLFHGTGFDDYIRDLRKRYTQVKVRKPDASRTRSPEVYALATGKLATMK